MGCGESDTREPEKKPANKSENYLVTDSAKASPKASAKKTAASPKSTAASPKASAKSAAASPKASAKSVAASPKAVAKSKASAKSAATTPKASAKSVAASPKAAAKSKAATSKASAKSAAASPKASAKSAAASPKAEAKSEASSPKEDTTNPTKSEASSPKEDTTNPTKSVRAKGKITFSIQKAEIFKKRDLIGKCDPFLIVKVDNVEKKTSTVCNTQYPQWWQTLLFDGVSADKAFFTLCDEDPKDIIGTAELSLEHFKRREEKHITLSLTEKGTEEAKAEINVLIEDSLEKEKDMEEEKEKEKEKDKVNAPSMVNATVSSLSALFDGIRGEDNGGVDNLKIHDLVMNTTAIKDLFGVLEELGDGKKTEVLEEGEKCLAIALDLLFFLGGDFAGVTQIHKPEYPPKLVQFCRTSSSLYAKRLAALMYLFYEDSAQVPVHPVIAAQLQEIVDSFSKAAMGGLVLDGEGPPDEARKLHFCSEFSFVFRNNTILMWEFTSQFVFSMGTASVRMLVANGLLNPAVKMMAHDSATVGIYGAEFLVAAFRSKLVAFEDLDQPTYFQAVEKSLKWGKGDSEVTYRARQALLGLNVLTVRNQDDIMGEVKINEMWAALAAAPLLRTLVNFIRRLSDVMYTADDPEEHAIQCINVAGVVVRFLVKNGCQRVGTINYCMYIPQLRAVDAYKIFQYFFVTGLPLVYRHNTDDFGSALRSAALIVCAMSYDLRRKDLPPVDIYGTILDFLQYNNFVETWAWAGLKDPSPSEVIQEWKQGGERLGKRPECSLVEED